MEKKLCMVVDDSGVVRKVCRRILENLGFEVVEAEDGKKALEIVEKITPNFILLDWNMPVMNGLEFLLEYRKNHSSNDVKIIFCTTENDIAKIMTAMEAGANEYIMKPFDEEIVKKQINADGIDLMSLDLDSKTDQPYKVLIVDDSSVIRSILSKILKEAPFVEIVGKAENGKIAIDLAKSLQPDVILLDIEMPIMDGISALPHILKASPFSQVIMVSTLTEKNAAISMIALECGASDYLQKPESNNIDKDTFKSELLRKIQALGFVSREKKSNNSTQLGLNKNISPIPQKTNIPAIKTPPALFVPVAIAIASSTGGPQALQTVCEGLKNNIPDLPIFITQHMPPVFTKYLANSLATINSIKCHEAEDDMEVQPGNIYMAPGDFHMLVKNEDAKIKIKLSKEPPENFCRPSADPMLRSLMEVYGSKLLVVVLTGMGQDGLLGAKAFANKGGVVIAQDKETSVVWGMPGAVCEAGIASGIYPINQISERIIEICKKRAI